MDTGDATESEPSDVDEQRYGELGVVVGDAMLRGRPIDGHRCQTCRYYLEPDADLSYCWYPKIRLLVGADWWCQWWDGDG